MRSLVDAIRRAATRRPSAPALHSPARTVTYKELIHSMDGAAGALRARGVGPGCRVAVCLDRSPEMAIGILATLAAGAAYVPLDPAAPRATLERTLIHSESSLLLGRSDTEGLAATAGIARVDPDLWPSSDRAETTSGSGPAYLVYTSGSTGAPKGVVVGTSALENYLSWAVASLPFTGAGVPLFASIAFDHTVTTLFPPLMMGETVYLLPPLGGGRAFALNLFDCAPYSFVKITPSHFRLLDTEDRARLGRSTALVMFGGERLTAHAVNEVRRDNPSLAVMNHYGPTECTVGCCVYRLPQGGAVDPIPIGQPIPGVVVKLDTVEDTALAEASHCEGGELLVAGRCLADGYWRQPELTDASFVSIAAASGASTRWYRTGDFVSMAATGDLTFVGRSDSQVKILGHRIELSEVERALTSYPAVRDAAVLTVDSAAGLRLVAAVAVTDPVANADAIRAFVREKLPTAMVPWRVLVLDRLPTTVNGKLDAALVRTLATEPEVSADHAVMEDAIAIKFRGAVGVAEVGLDQDFFLLGGDSLAAVDLTLWASQRFGVELELATLFECSTIRLLAARIRELQRASTESGQ